MDEQIERLRNPQVEPEEAATAEARQLFKRGMARHRRFRQRTQEYRQWMESHQAAVGRRQLQVKQLRESAQGTIGEAIVGKRQYDEAMRQLRQDFIEEGMVRDGLRHQLSDIRDEFAELKKPENDVVQLQRELQKHTRP